jgi:hypothetical protein
MGLLLFSKSAMMPVARLLAAIWRMDLYSHVTDTMQQDAAARLDLALGGAIRAASGGNGTAR